MTMSRGSALIAAEGYVDNGDPTKENETPNFGRGRGYYKKKKADGTSERCAWVELPPGTYINTQHNRTAEAIRAMGTKNWDTVVYGKFTGSFDITFNLDYEYLHFLKFIFEGTEFKMPDGSEDLVVYDFKKIDNKRVRSFTLKRIILNKMAGGPLHSDEIEQLMGCIVANVSFSRSSNTSNIGVAITGFFAYPRMYKGTIDRTEYMPYEGKLCEYMCMFVNDATEKEIEDCEYVANVEAISIQIGNNAERIYNTCSPYAGTYFEGLSSYKIDFSIYSNNPLILKQRVYGGGEQVKGDGDSYIIIPKVKGLKPMGTIKLLTYDEVATNDENIGAVTKDEVMTAWRDSKHRLEITVSDTIIKSLTWPKGDNQKITDHLSSSDCKYMSFRFTMPTGLKDVYDMWDNPANKEYLIHRFDESKLMGPIDW